MGKFLLISSILLSGLIFFANAESVNVKDFSQEKEPHKVLDNKAVFNNDYPQFLAFRGEMSKNSLASYEAWAASIGKSCGFMRKLVYEELDINPMTQIWTGQYAKEHPEKLMLIHLNGEARQVVDFPEVRERYFPGHWVYHAGSAVSADISAVDTLIKLENITPFRHRGYADRRKNSAGGFLPLQLLIVRLDENGEKLWYDSEYAVLKSYNIEDKTIVVERGQYDSKPSSYKAGEVYVAPIAGDQWGKHVMWFYNLSSVCPKDRNGRQANELYAEEIVSWYKEGSVLEELQGIAFDVNYFDVSKKKSHWDVDNDGKADGGWINDENVWMRGDVRFLEMVREGLGDDYIISADAQHYNNQQIPTLLNGMESEGLVQHDDMWRGFSRAVNTHLFWSGHRHTPYDYRYVVMKVMGQDEYRTPQMRRFGAASAFCLGASITSPNGVFLPEEFSAPGSLGKPVAPVQRYAKMQSPVLRLSGEELARHIEVEDGEVVVKEGKVYLKAFGEARERELKAMIKDVEMPEGDVCFFVKARAVEGRNAYSEKYDIPRIMWLRPETLPVHDSIPKYREYFNDLYGLFGSETGEMSYYFRGMPQGSQNIQLKVSGKGELVIESFDLYAAPDILIREFEYGMVVVNPSMSERKLLVTEQSGRSYSVSVPPIDAAFIKK